MQQQREKIICHTADKTVTNPLKTHYHQFIQNNSDLTIHSVPNLSLKIYQYMTFKIDWNYSLNSSKKFPIGFSINQLNLMLNLMLKQNDYQISYAKNLGELIKLKILKSYKILGYKWYSFEFSYKVLQYNGI